MSYQLIRGDATAIPLADDSVDLICTSPPYFALRSYTDGGEHYDGQIGSEATPQAYLEAMWAWTAECRRVLKPSGSLFCNLGDKYAGGGMGGHGLGLHGPPPQGERNSYRRPTNTGGIPAKSLMGLPWRYAIGCIDQLGLILRAEIVWAKPNCLSGGTVVYARTKGRERTIKVHDLCRHYQPEDVQLWNGQQWTQVVWWQPTDRAEGAQVEIEFRNGQRVGCTNEHRWPVLGKGNVAASDLAPGDVIESCGTPEGTKRPERVDDAEIGWFVGLYIAEGSRSGTTIQIASHADETARYKRLTALAESFGENCAAHVTSANGMTINLTGRFLDAILSTFVGGKDAYTKHLRPEAWTRSNRFLRAVLEGYLDGDGHDNGAGRWTVGFTGRNDDLAADLRALGARLGASVRLRRGTTTGFGQEWPAWTGTIYFDASRRKRPDAEVVAIRPSRARRFWDIGVEDDPHLFALASGVLTHNSLPESVTDRVRRSHEQWFHFTKEPRYFSAVDEVREPQTGTAGMPRPDFEKEWISSEGGTNHRTGHSDPRLYNPLGKLPGSVWTIDSQLWLDGPIHFCPRCGRDLRAGSGPDGSIKRATATIGSLVMESGESTASPTSFGSDQSPTGTPSTTPATTTQTVPVGSDVPIDDASTLTTSKPSPCESTSSEATHHPGRTPERPTASTATSSPKQTPPSGVTVGASAACVCEIGLAATAPPSTWVVPTEPLRVPDHLGVDHFAAFPSEWPRRLILGFGPSGVCLECGEGRRPVVAKERVGVTQRRDATTQLRGGGSGGGYALPGADTWQTTEATITGYACACPDTTAPTRPAVILDPFCGTGTVPAVAHALGRHGIGIDLSADYLRLAEWRCENEKLAVKVAERSGMAAPAGEHGGMEILPLFGDA